MSGAELWGGGLFRGGGVWCVMEVMAGQWGGGGKWLLVPAPAVEGGGGGNGGFCLKKVSSKAVLPHPELCPGPGGGLALCLSPPRGGGRLPGAWRAATVPATSCHRFRNGGGDDPHQRQRGGGTHSRGTPPPALGCAGGRWDV